MKINRQLSDFATLGLFVSEEASNENAIKICYRKLVE